MPAAIVERSCDYCGLPAGSAPRGAAAEHPVYCCLGCRFAASVSGEGGEEGVSRWTLTKLGLSIFFSLNVMVFTMALWSQDLFAAPTDATQQARLLYDLFRYLALLFSLPVVFLLGGPLLESAWSDLTQRRISADLLLALGVLAALVYSMSSVFSGRGHVYFEVACMVLVAVTLGRWIEATGRWRTTQSLRRLSRLLPEQVQVVQPGGLVARRPLEEVRKGAVVRTLAGQCIPLDGRIVSGTASIDAQVITGESQPVVKGSGDEVFGGSLCLDGLLEVEVTADSRQGTLARLVAEVERAAHARGRWRRLADRLAALFVPRWALPSPSGWTCSCRW